MKTLTLVRFLALGLTACRKKKAVEAGKIGDEWLGITIMFPDFELITPYSIAIDKAVLTGGHTKFKSANDIWWLCKNNLDKFGGLSNSPHFSSLFI
jgi:hypothetical protein